MFPWVAGVSLGHELGLCVVDGVVDGVDCGECLIHDGP